MYPGNAVKRPNEYPTRAAVEASIAMTGNRRWIATGAAMSPATT